MQNQISLPEKWGLNQAPHDQQSDSETVKARIAKEVVAIPNWIIQFENPQLNALVREAFKSNFDLKVAVARMEKARAQATASGAVLRPNVSASLSSARSRANLPQKSIGSSKSLSVDMSWEIDLWNRLSLQAKASIRDFNVTEADWQAARLSLSANVAKAWFDLTQARLQMELVERRIENLSNNLSTIQQEFDLGLKAALDVYLARANVERERAKLSARQRGFEQASRTIAVLLGRYPSVELVGGSDFESLNTLLAVKRKVPQLPSELLLRRWDLIAWRHQLAAANSRMSAAHYNRFPRFSLTSNTGSRSDKFGDLLSSDFFVWSFLGSVSAPLFDGKRLASEARKAEANVREVEANYSKALLSAFQQVENAIGSEQLLMEQESALDKAVSESLSAEKLAFENYLNGLVGFITVLESQRSLFDSQSAAIDVRNQRIKNRIDLHLALGGSF